MSFICLACLAASGLSGCQPKSDTEPSRAGSERPQTEAHEVRDRALVQESIEPVREAPAGDEGQAQQGPTRGKAGAQGGHADDGQQEGNQADEYQLTQPGRKAGAEAQKRPGVGGELEPQRIGRNGDAREFARVLWAICFAT